MSFLGAGAFAFEQRLNSSALQCCSNTASATADIEESFDQQRRRLPSGFQGRARHTPEDRLEPWDLLEVGFQLAQVNFLHLGGVGVDQLGLQPPGQIPEPYELASEDAGPVLPPWLLAPGRVRGNPARAVVEPPNRPIVRGAKQARANVHLPQLPALEVVLGLVGDLDQVLLQVMRYGIPNKLLME